MTVDVFTQGPYAGNPVTVVLDGQGLDSATMLAFTRWTHLSEATFVLPPSAGARAQGADYQVRIFSPAGEMDFACHPTLGTCHAWLAHGGKPQSAQRIVQECGYGLVAITPSAQGLAFAAPAMQHRPLPPQLPLIYAALGLSAAQVLECALLDVGTPWLCVRLASPQVLLALRPQPAQLQTLATLFEGDVGLGLCALEPPCPHPAPTQRLPQLQVRAFTLDGAEDPVTGSLNACLAQWLTQQGHLTAPYWAQQGRCVGRDGWIGVRQDAQQQLWIEGHSVTCITGQVWL